MALVGVNAPYAGFAGSPEAQAARGAAGLGTLVVAGAGEEGPAAPGSGTIGAPAAGADVLAVGALAAPRCRTWPLTVGDVRVRAALLGGRPPRPRCAPPGRSTPPTSRSCCDPARRPCRAGSSIVRAGDNPPARAAAAAAAGARAVLLADPRSAPLAAMPAGRVGVPVIGVTGDAAEAVLREDAGKQAEFGASSRGGPPSAAARRGRTGRRGAARALAVLLARPGGLGRGRSPTSWRPAPR